MEKKEAKIGRLDYTQLLFRQIERVNSAGQKDFMSAVKNLVIMLRPFYDNKFNKAIEDYDDKLAQAEGLDVDYEDEFRIRQIATHELFADCIDLISRKADIMKTFLVGAPNLEVDATTNEHE